MKKLLLLFVSLLTSTLLWAQTDMTDRIVNPSFEEEREGWEIHSFGCQTNNAFTLKDGRVYLETWRPAGDRAGDARIKQVIEGLPAGSYTLSCIAQNIQENNKTAVQTGTWMFANDDITQVNLPNRYEVNTVVVDGTLAIGFVAENATGNYVCVDAFTLTLNEPDEHTFEVFRQELVKLVAEAEALSENTGTPQQATLDACITEAKAVIDGTADKDVTVVFVALREAIEAYHFSIASPSNPLEVTGRITNPDFENSTKGWTCDGGFNSQTNTAFELKQGTTYLEIWGWTVAADGYAYQDVPLPNGNYHLTALAQNILQSSSGTKQKGAWIYANTSKTDINHPGMYEMNFSVVGGTARIGIKTEACTGNYVCLDDIHIYYIGMDNDALMAELKNLINSGEALLPVVQSAATRAALKTAVDDAKAVTSAEGIGDKAATLTAAIYASEASIGEYEKLTLALTEAEAIYDALGGNAGKAFKAVIDEARAKCEAGTATPDDIELYIIKLHREGILYMEANGTGEVPEVITYNFVPEGATGALGRLKVKGFSDSQLKYKGFCWARHDCPTLKDDFTTTGEKLYDYPGLIYVMEPMEPATEYWVRAFAMTKDNQVGYGQVRRIIT
ncbi:MAG: hypothetical protein HUK02_04895, partial [Bacteroidaceae bacterium]|nr:hypothetical protein [Bacteroidaceae bacterium]